MQDVCTDAEILTLLVKARSDEPLAYDRLYNLYAVKIFRYAAAYQHEDIGAHPYTGTD